VVMLIRKSSGELVEFSLEKLRDSVMRAGADGVLTYFAPRVAEKLKNG